MFIGMGLVASSTTGVYWDGTRRLVRGSGGSFENSVRFVVTMDGRLGSPHEMRALV